jgi:ATP-binding cassette subfamily E protein 1
MYLQRVSENRLKTSVKPQYIDFIPKRFRGTVGELLASTDERSMLDRYVDALSLHPILQAPASTLSGGELQRVAIAACLAREADLYILDEPSAHLDVEQRVKLPRIIRSHAQGREAGVLVIDHDIYLIDIISEGLIVFSGEPGIRGDARGPFRMQEGMNRFLGSLGVSFRRDRSGRPRINKPGSFLDREQKASGAYYYAEVSKG